MMRSVFENPQAWDNVTLPGVIYLVEGRDSGGRVLVDICRPGPCVGHAPLTLDEWQEVCLRPGAMLSDQAELRAYLATLRERVLRSVAPSSLVG
jgi:hypothetical protein